MRITIMSLLIACTCIGAMFAMSSPAGAFSLSGFGGKLGYMSPENLDGTTTLGAHLEFERHESRVHLIPSVMYWKTDDLSDLSANADLYYHFLREGLMTPYVGAGLGLNFFSSDRSNQSDSKLGVNLFGGVRLPAGALHYFLEGRYTASDLSQFAVLGGITLHRGSGH